MLLKIFLECILYIIRKIETRKIKPAEKQTHCMHIKLFFLTITYVIPLKVPLKSLNH